MNIYVEIAREALWLVIWLSLLPLVASLIVGLLISFFQALTQIQEQTLTFVPKIIVTILVILITANFMLSQLIIFSNRIFDLMLQIGRPG
ncbi:MAG TPA: flagellar biosynthetic protein FliQ [Pyrinomonadaceae bacterium]|jgi:flagellar biosynthetic protein FliQ